ncbi:MAG: cache domain-containing protein [Thermodesulfobacteriota bacterium]|nr:cache domain-containing protein [Thermodesulfobacteriota bacterium]
MVLPLVLIPILLVGVLVGYISMTQAQLGISRTSRDDLAHMSSFTLDLLNAHYLQYQVYKEDKVQSVRRNLESLVNLAYNLVEAQHLQNTTGQIESLAARKNANHALKNVSVGETGYIYAMTSAGNLTVHIANQGVNIYNSQDEEGRYFIQEMSKNALSAAPGEVLYTAYPWKNALLGDEDARQKIVAYRYFAPWDWIIAVGSYLDETFEDLAFENRAFLELKNQIKAKQVGRTGYIYVVDTTGYLKIHPFQEGKNLLQEKDEEGRYFIREMCEKKKGWIRYPWQNIGEDAPRMKIVRYDYFEPWQWVVAVGSYEDEFYGLANAIKRRIVIGFSVLVLVVGVFASLFVFWMSKAYTDPLYRMIDAMHKVKQGRLDEKADIVSRDEFGELAATFNDMTAILQRNKELESGLAKQEKMASLGVLSSEVAHEINNPLGVILGYAGYLEGKIEESDPKQTCVTEIKQECRRCMRIVKGLLGYAKARQPSLSSIDINGLLSQIVDIALGYRELQGISITKDFLKNLPQVMADEDQIRQVANNLIVNGAAAMPQGGQLRISTSMVDDTTIAVVFADTGTGISSDHMEKIYNPFFSTKADGTGLGLSICKEIIQAHQGEITISSEQGKGTTVTIYLPVGHMGREQ